MREVDVRDDEAVRQIDLWSQRGVDDSITKAMLPALCSDSAAVSAEAQQWMHDHGGVGYDDLAVRQTVASARRAASDMTQGMHPGRVYSGDFADRPEALSPESIEDRLMDKWVEQDPQIDRDPFSHGNEQARERLLGEQVDSGVQARQTSFVREVDDVTDGWD